MIRLHQGNGIIPWRLQPICPAAPLYSCFTSIFSAGFQPSHLHCDCILKCTQVVSRQEKYSTANHRQPERPVGRCNYPVTVKRKEKKKTHVKPLTPACDHCRVADVIGRSSTKQLKSAWCYSMTDHQRSCFIKHLKTSLSPGYTDVYSLFFFLYLVLLIYCHQF